VPPGIDGTDRTERMPVAARKAASVGADTAVGTSVEQPEAAAPADMAVLADMVQQALRPRAAG